MSPDAEAYRLPWDDEPEPLKAEKPPAQKTRGRKSKPAPAKRAAVVVAPGEEDEFEEEEILTKDEFVPWMEDQMLANAPALCKALYPSLQALVVEKNLKAIEIVMNMLGLVKSNAGGVNIIQNFANIGAGGMASQDPRDGTPRGFESIIRVLEMRDMARSRGLGPATSVPLPDLERQPRAITIEAEPEQPE